MSSRVKLCGSALVALTLLTMLVAAPASAHRLSGQYARKAVAAHASHTTQPVPAGTFVSAVVECDRFSQHHFICGVAYETAGTDGKPQVACRELVTAFVKNHTDRLRLKVNALCKPTPVPSKPAPLPPNTELDVGSFSVASQCVGLQFGNAGNVGPFNSPPAPDNPVACEQAVQQSSAASS